MKKILLVTVLAVGLILAAAYIQYRINVNPGEVVLQENPPIIPPAEYAPVKTDHRSEILSTFFIKNGMPLGAYTDLFITAADTFGHDYRLLPAISVRESSGGKEACGFNPFGWDSCNGYNFQSYDEAITYVAWRLAESPYYADKTDYQKLRIYNSEIELYPDQVLAIMQMIQKDE